ncbi:MAG TPA: PspA/IM30 family protein [Candidatus Binatia bacterium]|nr:PspA/IM30 family protein [Candidatus Binatia bacterium]
MSFLARLRNLVSGLLGQWIGRREHKNPGAIYEAAIHERLDQYGKLRSAAAGVLYMRTKLAKELELKSAELGRVARQLELAVEADDDEAALVLIGRRDGLSAEVERVTAELHELETEAETAKRNLSTFHAEIARLRDEKVRMLARLANAKARLKLQETLTGLSPDADIRALDAVRDHINRIVEEAKVTRDLGDSELERRLGKIRAAEADAAARSQLEELKRTRRERLLPMVMRERTAVPSAGAI